jgi:hypothetical protein
LQLSLSDLSLEVEVEATEQAKFYQVRW